MESLLRDLTFACRTLARRPGLTAAATLSLALGIGANSTIFTLVNAVLLRPLPGVEEPARVVLLYATDRAGSYLPISYPNYESLREDSAALSGLAAFQSLHLSLLEGEEPQKIHMQVVTHDYFTVLGVEAAVGRTLAPEDDRAPGCCPVAVLSHGFWHQVFGGDPRLLGSTVTLDGQPFTVVGVTPPGFKGTSALHQPTLWVPMSMYREVSPYAERLRNRGAQMFEMVGRLGPGVPLRRARAELATLAARLRREYPDVNEGQSLQAEPLPQAAIDPRVRPLYVRSSALLLAGTGLLLLIACGNVASLLLARGLEQRKEVSLRLCLGARRGQLVRQLVIQSLVLSLAGGAVGLLLSLRAPPFLWQFRPPYVLTTAALDLGLHGRVVAFTLSLSVATGLLFGLLPALASTRPGLAAALKEEPRRFGRSPRRASVRDALVAAQVCLCFLSLTGAVLFLKSLRHAQRIDPGFDVDRLLVVTYDLASQTGDPEETRALHRHLLDSLRRRPEISAVAQATNQPLGRGPAFHWNVAAGADDSSWRRDGPLFRSDAVTPSYFETLGIPLTRGRGFDDGDREDAPLVAVVNETMARRLWPGEDPVGQRFRLPNGDLEVEVVGVAGDSTYISLGEDPRPCFYFSLFQRPGGELTFYVRTEGHPAALLETVRRHLRSLAPQITLSKLHTMSEVVQEALWAQRLGASLLTLFGIVALVLAATGIYAVLAYTARQRLKEMGIRLALGAARVDVLRLLVGRALAVVTGGLALGLLAAWSAGRLLANLLYGIHPTDAATYVEIAGALAIVSLAAAYGAARRATRVDPAQVLAAE